MEKIITDLALSLVAAVLSVLCGYKMYQIFQLSSYKTKGVINWIKISKFDYVLRYFALAAISFILMFVYVTCFSRYGKYISLIGFLFLIGFAVTFIIIQNKEKKKTPLKLTSRVMRMMVLSGILYVGLYYGLLRLGQLTVIGYSFMGIGFVFIPIITALSVLILKPFEFLNNYGFKRRAVNCLGSMPQLIKIGITGSFGKTTTKFILAKMLEKKYKVCYSPGSYNTPMGISIVINRDLLPDHEIFIAEMGARNPGDIAELAQMIQPNYGLITAIGKQHLETFGSEQAIAATKYELIENLAAGGLAVFNGDSPECVNMYKNCTTAKYLTGGETLSGANSHYSDVKVGTDGTSFKISIAGETAEIKTVLLGKHIPGLVLMAARIAVSLGVSLKEIQEACSELGPVPHRLELIQKGAVTIIDDAYNSNPEGAKNALEILSKFSGMTRIIITPGMIELGSEEKELNSRLGEAIAANADYAVLLGPHSSDIKAGAAASGMDETRILTATSVDEAVEMTSTITGEKVILFENDLPDNY